MTARKLLCAAGALFALIAAGCGTSAPAVPAAAPQARSTEELEAIYRARVESERTHFTEADVHFMTGMIGHHAQALVMAAKVPTHGANAELQRLAARIDNAQRDEIALMQGWLRDRGRPVPEVHVMEGSIMVHGAGDHAAHEDMPGMLSPAQLALLDRARGAEFDRLFLNYMIQHHAGAVVMVDSLFATDGAAQDEDAFRIASDIQVDQRTEIARMQLMLDALE